MKVDLLLEHGIPHRYTQKPVGTHLVGVRTFSYDGPIINEYSREDRALRPLNDRFTTAYTMPRFFSKPWGIVLDVQNYQNQILVEYFTSQTASHAHLLGALSKIGYSESYLQSIGRDGQLVETGIPHLNPKFTLLTDYGAWRPSSMGIYSDFDCRSTASTRKEAALRYIELIARSLVEVAGPDVSALSQIESPNKGALLTIAGLPGRNVITQRHFTATDQ
jgi:hypothetical protein